MNPEKIKVQVIIILLLIFILLLVREALTSNALQQFKSFVNDKFSQKQSEHEKVQNSTILHLFEGLMHSTGEYDSLKLLSMDDFNFNEDQLDDMESLILNATEKGFKIIDLTPYESLENLELFLNKPHRQTVTKELSKKVNHLIEKMKRFRDINVQGKQLYDTVKFIEKGYQECALNLSAQSSNLPTGDSVRQKKQKMIEKEDIAAENLTNLHAAQRIYNEFVQKSKSLQNELESHKREYFSKFSDIEQTVREARVKIQHTEEIDLQCKNDEEALLKESQTLMLKIETLKEFQTSLISYTASHFIDEGRKSKDKNHVHDLFIQLESFYNGEADELQSEISKVKKIEADLQKQKEEVEAKLYACAHTKLTIISIRRSIADIDKDKKIAEEQLKQIEEAYNESKIQETLAGETTIKAEKLYNKNKESIKNLHEQIENEKRNRQNAIKLTKKRIIDKINQCRAIRNDLSYKYQQLENQQKLMQNETSENIRLKYMVEQILEYLVYTKTQRNSSITESFIGLEEL